MDFKVEIICACKSKCLIPIKPDTEKYICATCGRSLFKIQAIAGQVYILSNTSMKGLFKIGCTERSAKERVDELNGTGVPVPFTIEAIFDSSAPFDDEGRVHEMLSEYRLSKDREFSTLGLKDAVQRCIDCLGSRPTFLRSPELLMNHLEKRVYREKVRMEQKAHMDELEEIRSEFIDLAKTYEKDLRYIDNVVANNLMGKSRLTDEQKVTVERLTRENFYYQIFWKRDRLTNNDSQGKKFINVCHEIEAIRQVYYRYPPFPDGFIFGDVSDEHCPCPHCNGTQPRKNIGGTCSYCGGDMWDIFEEYYLETETMGEKHD